MAANLIATPALSLHAWGQQYIDLKPLQPAPASNTSGVNIHSDEPIELRGRISTVPSGTMLMIKVEQPVSSFSTRLGDPVMATLENDIFINDVIAIPAGSEVQGEVANVKPSGHMGTHGLVDIRFNSIKTPSGTMVPIRAHVVTSDQTGVLKGDTYSKDVLKGVAIAAGGTGLGTLGGLAAGSLIGSAGAGALFGLSMGAIGGMGYAVMRKGKEVVVPSGSRMSIQLEQPVSVNL